MAVSISHPELNILLCYGYLITSDNTGIYKGIVRYYAGLKLLVNHVGALLLSVHKKTAAQV